MTGGHHHQTETSKYDQVYEDPAIAQMVVAQQVQYSQNSLEQDPAVSAMMGFSDPAIMGGEGVI